MSKTEERFLDLTKNFAAVPDGASGIAKLTGFAEGYQHRAPEAEESVLSWLCASGQGGAETVLAPMSGDDLAQANEMVKQGDLVADGDAQQINQAEIVRAYIIV